MINMKKFNKIFGWLIPFFLLLLFMITFQLSHFMGAGWKVLSLTTNTFQKNNSDAYSYLVTFWKVRLFSTPYYNFLLRYNLHGFFLSHSLSRIKTEKINFPLRKAETFCWKQNQQNGWVQCSKNGCWNDHESSQNYRRSKI